VADIHARTGQILSQGAGSVQQVAGQPSAGANYDLSRPIQEMKESLNIVRRDLTTANQKLAQNAQIKCPEVAAGGGDGQSSCVSVAVFVTIAFVQLIILISYLWYR